MTVAACTSPVHRARPLRLRSSVHIGRTCSLKKSTHPFSAHYPQPFPNPVNMSFYGSRLTAAADISEAQHCPPSSPRPRRKRTALDNSTNRRAAASRQPAKRSKMASTDRFIPSRSAMDLDISRMTLYSSTKENAPSSSADNLPSFNYKSCLQSSILHSNSPNRAASASRAPPSARNPHPEPKILSFQADTPAPTADPCAAATSALYANQCGLSSRRRAPARFIATKPVKILDAPNIQEDFYLNLLDWGSTGALAVALYDSVYLWNAESGSIHKLCDTDAPDDHVTSVQWSNDGRFVAVGTNHSQIQLWDASRIAKLRQWSAHTERVGALAWNNWTLTSGGRDARIVHSDVRARAPPYAALTAHTEEICGLKWSPSGQQLASGANDNLVCVWDAGVAGLTSASSSHPRLKLDTHVAAVKALAWCPQQANLLATGGGTADRTLRFWNTASGACVKSIDTMSQVSGIQWSPTAMELVTSHGFSQNQLTVWKYSSLTRLAELKGHTHRVLQLALSPDGTTVVSGGADETLRFWKVFESNSARRAARANALSKSSVLSHQRLVLR